MASWGGAIRCLLHEAYAQARRALERVHCTAPGNQHTTASVLERGRCDRSPLHCVLEGAAAHRRWPLQSQSGHRTDERRSESAHLSPGERGYGAGTHGRFPGSRAPTRVRFRRPRSPDRHRSIVARTRSCPAPLLRGGSPRATGTLERTAKCVRSRAPGGVSSSELERRSGLASWLICVSALPENANRALHARHGIP